VTMRTPAVKAMGRLRRGLLTSPAILPASHHPPKQKKALMAAPAMAPMSGSDPLRRNVSGARLARVAWPETSAQPTSPASTGTLSQLRAVMKPLERRVPAKLIAPSASRMSAGSEAASHPGSGTSD